MPDISLSWPVALPRITQQFGERPVHHLRPTGPEFGRECGVPVMSFQNSLHTAG